MGNTTAYLVRYIKDVSVYGIVNYMRPFPANLLNNICQKIRDYDICLSRDFLTPDDRVLFIDDFLANGNAALGAIDLIEKAGAELVGMGFLIEKAFQPGGELLRRKGIHVESLAIIESLKDCQIRFRE